MSIGVLAAFQGRPTFVRLGPDPGVEPGLGDFLVAERFEGQVVDRFGVHPGGALKETILGLDGPPGEAQGQFLGGTQAEDREAVEAGESALVPGQVAPSAEGDSSFFGMASMCS